MFCYSTDEYEINNTISQISNKMSCDADGIPCSIFRPVGNFVATPFTQKV